MKDDQLVIVFDDKNTQVFAGNDDDPIPRELLQDDTNYIQDCITHGIQPAPGFYRITRLINVGTFKLVEID